METVPIKSWNEFREYVDKDRQIMPVYWRGQAQPDPLASKFERLILNLFGGYKPESSKIYPYDGRYKRNGNKGWRDGTYQVIRDRYLERFKKSASGLRGPNPKELTTDQWWALGRHYELVTPLLDWTEAPYIAAFFALTETWKGMKVKGNRTFGGKEAAVYKLFHNESLEGDGLRVVKPIIEEHVRMQGQQGLFTWLDTEDYFELQGFLNDTGRGNLLTCLLLSDQVVPDGLRDLEAHGINYRTLFPDLGGAANYANYFYDEKPF